MVIFVKTLTGKTIEIKCASNTFVDEIKSAIQDKESIPPEYQRLVLKGEELEDCSSPPIYLFARDSNSTQGSFSLITTFPT
jgi:hypothetical protein